MKFNLLTAKRVYADTGPYKSLTETDLESLRDGDTSASGIVVGVETLAVIADFGARYRLDNLKYYRDAAASENVALFGRQGADSSYLWESISYTDEGDYLSADLSQIGNRYEFIKVVHTVLSGQSTVYEFIAVTDDGEVAFGPEGQATVFSVDSGTVTLFSEEIQVFNPTQGSHSFFFLPDGEDQDSVGLALGATSSGSFVALHEGGLSVPTTFSWSSGEKTNVVEQGDNLVLSSGTSGVFYTPVIDISTLDGRRLFWNATLSGTNVIDDSTRDDSVSTISARFSNEVPTDGGWVSGQTSVDSNWSTVSGVLSFEPYDNYHIIHPKYLNYFQARVEFSSAADGQTPVLHSVGVEVGLELSIPAGQYGVIFAKSQYPEHVYGRKTNLLAWFFETSNEEQQ